MYLRNEYTETCCIDGHMVSHELQSDGNLLENDIGKCKECEGEGCDSKIWTKELVQELIAIGLLGKTYKYMASKDVS